MTTSLLLIRYKCKEPRSVYGVSHMVVGIILKGLICIIVNPPGFTAFYFTSSALLPSLETFQITGKKSVCLAAVTIRQI